jgi:phage baseplate assembly protein W
MTLERYRAWRFVHPDLVAAEGTPAGGLQVTSGGGIDTVSGDASIRQAILLLLSTSPGERVMRPTYGCHLRRLVFSPNDDTTAGLAIHYVRTALDAWEPRIDILKLDAQRRGDTPEVLEIVLVYRVRETNRTDILTYAVSLTGEAV